MGDRKISQYAEDSRVNRTYISKYINERLDTPPTPDILKRLANSAQNNITYEELMKAAGHITDDLSIANEIKKDVNELDIPKEYTDKHKVTKRDKEQYKEFLKREAEAFFMNDEFDEADKKELLDVMSELFWEAKALNKRKSKKYVGDFYS